MPNLNKMIDKKHCSRCKEEKEITEYYLSKGRYSSACKVCKSDMYKDWEKRNPEKRRELHEKYYSKRRWYLLKSKYGITKKQYEDLLEKQDFKCAICKSIDANHNKSSNLLVDHCHSSMQIRGLLCHNCNSTLGLLKDDVVVLESMIAYLKK